jgi:hypothetical protein
MPDAHPGLNREQLREYSNEWRRRNYDPEKQRQKGRRYRSNPEVRERLRRKAREAQIMRGGPAFISAPPRACSKRDTLADAY